MLRVSAYGQTGPMRETARLRPHRSRLRRPELLWRASRDGTPVVPGSTSLADYMSGMWGAVGVLMALRVAERTGRGQYIDIGLYEFGLPRARRDRAGLRAARLRARAHGRRYGQRRAAQPLSDGRRRAGSRSPAPATRCSSAWPRSWRRPELDRARVRAPRSAAPPQRRGEPIVGQWVGRLTVRECWRRLRRGGGAVRSPLHHRRHLRRPAVPRAAEPGRGG